MRKDPRPSVVPLAHAAQAYQQVGEFVRRTELQVSQRQDWRQVQRCWAPALWRREKRAAIYHWSWDSPYVNSLIWLTLNIGHANTLIQQIVIVVLI
jgi:hypothetical protein